MDDGQVLSLLEGMGIVVPSPQVAQLPRATRLRIEGYAKRLDVGFDHPVIAYMIAAAVLGNPSRQRLWTDESRRRYIDAQHEFARQKFLVAAMKLGATLTHLAHFVRSDRKAKLGMRELDAALTQNAEAVRARDYGKLRASFVEVRYSLKAEDFPGDLGKILYS